MNDINKLKDLISGLSIDLDTCSTRQGKIYYNFKYSLDLAYMLNNVNFENEDSLEEFQCNLDELSIIIESELKNTTNKHFKSIENVVWVDFDVFTTSVYGWKTRQDAQELLSEFKVSGRITLHYQINTDLFLEIERSFKSAMNNMQKIC